jgi:hypothetical protein
VIFPAGENIAACTTDHTVILEWGKRQTALNKAAQFVFKLQNAQWFCGNN